MSRLAHHCFTVIFMLITLAACATQSVHRDSAPRTIPVNLDTVPEPVPKPEPVSKYGNPASYQVNGKTYFTLNSNLGFRQTGYASWYGTKFQGRRTSSGEPYDMFAITAAHKRLPIPSYVKVTNLENNKSIIVRVNDRGPFHSDRIIDLSYAAAHRLGYADKGTARVEVESISFETDKPEIMEPATSGHIYLQAGAFGERTNAEKLRALLNSHALMTLIESDNTPSSSIHRVLIGPLGGDEQAQQIQNLLDNIGINNAKLVRTSLRQ